MYGSDVGLNPFLQGGPECFGSETQPGGKFFTI
jgi:hypothetical protein